MAELPLRIWFLMPKYNIFRIILSVKIENGEITYPVSEVTIAGNLAEMLKNLIPANDLKINDNINSPSILIEGMTLAGL